MEKKEKQTKSKRALRKRRTRVAAGIVIIALIIAAAAGIMKLKDNNTETSTTITTYAVNSVTYGDVNTTISGSSALTPINMDTLTCSYPVNVTVTAVNYKAGDEVAADSVIATVTNDLTGDENIVAPYDGILIEVPVSVGDELESGGEVALIMDKSGFTMNISVDETNISSIQPDQEVTLTLDAVSGEFTGKVSKISYNGTSSSNSTTYDITATIDYAEGIYPGMNASAEIVTESSGDGLLVPVEAVQTSGDDNYVYIAPSGSENGKEYAEDEIDLSSLEKVNVTTGMSDGTYIMVESDDLAENDLVIVIKKTSTLTGSDSDDEDSSSRGFGGGEMPEGMQSGDFKPDDMPQGGSFPGSDGNSGKSDS